MILQNYYDLLNQPVRELSIRLFLYNKSFRKIGSLEGVCTGGNISISNSSDIRRTCKIDLVIKDSSFLVNNDKKIWIDKIIQVVILLKHNITNEYIPFNMGYYLIDAPSIAFSATDKKLSFSGIDLIANFLDKRNGQLNVTTKIPANTPISDAIRTVVKQIGKYDNLVIEESNRNLPMDIEKSAENTIYDLLKSVCDTFLDYEFFIDEDRVFYYQKVKNGKDDAILVDFTQQYKKLIIEPSIDFDFDNVRNSIRIVGKQMDNGTQVIYDISNTNINNKYSIPNIGEIKKVYPIDTVQTLEQAESWGNYYLYKHSNMCEKLVLSIVPIYFLSVNSKIRYGNSKLELEDSDYLITDLEIPLDISSPMKISCTRIYY